MSKITTEQFIERARVIHGNRYDYSVTELNGMNNKVAIICQVHGKFYQRAASHLSGSGCRLCNERQQLTKEQFIARANEKHNSKYSYDKVEYRNVATKVVVTCPIHGDFEQTPKDHLRKYGCPSCGGTTPVTKDEFMKRAREVHGDAYSYSALVVGGMNSKGLIMCLIHGEFEQRLADHLNGHGCPVCSLSKRGQYSEKYFTTFPDEKDVSAVLYLANVNDEFCKIGITKRNVSQRFANKEVQKVAEVRLPLYEAYVHEQRILQDFAQHRYRASGLRSRGFAGWTECFPLDMVPILQQAIEEQTS